MSARTLSAACVLAAAVLAVASAPELEMGPGGMWFGRRDGIKVVPGSGKNLAYTDDSPKVNPRLTRHSRKMAQAVYKIGTRTYLAYGYDLASTMMVVGTDGLIVIDPPTALESGRKVLEVFRGITDKPVRAIVYTHNHIDHVAGVRAFASVQDVAAGKVDIYGHESLLDAVVNWAGTLGPILGRRTSYTAATLLPRGPDGSVNDGIGPIAQVGTVTFIPPNKTFADRLEVTVAGVRMHLRHVPSETDDEIVAWFPDLKVLNTAEVIQGESFPNLHTIRGTKFRDPVQWFKGIDVLRAYPAEFMVPTHGRPVVGRDNIQNVLTAYRDAIQFVHDQTVRAMNKGMTPDELVEVVSLPPHLANHPWLGEFYGTVDHSVRQIYQGYLGWFQGDPWTLAPLPRIERARRYVQLMGGREQVLEAARKAVADGEHTWAAELLTHVIRVNKRDTEARGLKAEAYRRFAAEQTSINWRNWALSAAAELDGKPMGNGLSFASPDVIQSFPAGRVIEMLTTRIDPAKCLDVHMTMGIRLPDVKEEYALEIRRGVVQFHEGFPKKPDFTVVVDKAYLNRILIGDVRIVGEAGAAAPTENYRPLAGLLDGVDRGIVQIQGGTRSDLQTFFSYFDPPSDKPIDLILR